MGSRINFFIQPRHMLTEHFLGNIGAKDTNINKICSLLIYAHSLIIGSVCKRP